MVERLSDEDKSLFKEAFNSFVKEEGGPIQVEQAGDVLRKMGLTPTLEEIEEYKLEIDPQYMGDISYETMLDLYAKLVKPPHELEDEIAKAFRILDKDKNGFIDATELRNTLTTIGEALTEDEVDEMIAYMDTNGDGKILYENFIKDEPGPTAAPEE
ncbi:uncharacterized protein LOC120342961 [Styela clava]|uniref:calmodulin-2-like n=1 Tax=Styela clava TaxID=7725 RepID=UPI00193A2219|nr:calmodulin-2-like [Styela clava]XP_039267954.1 calmodulin-2-like [Styela clava]